MKLPTLPNRLNPEWLYLFIFGPGKGESIAVRIPDDYWLVIDSYISAHRAAVSYLLDANQANWSCLVLTHPHEDHHLGFEELLDRNPTGTVGCVHPQFNSGGAGAQSGDPFQKFAPNVRRIYDAIRRRWEEHPSSQWLTVSGNSIACAHGRLTSLHPPTPIRAIDWHGDKNELSSAMLLEWGAVRILFGADVVNTKWPEVADRHPNLWEHRALKVPHHGSREAIHDSYAGGARGRYWIVTPYNRLPRERKLPSAQDGEGLDLALRAVSEVHVTSLPYRHDCEDQPCVTTRAMIRDDIRPVALAVHLPNRRSGKALSTTDDISRYIMVAFDNSGVIVERRHGPGTVQVRA